MGVQASFSRWSAQELRSWTERVLASVGLLEKDALTVAACLIENSLRGVDTHGVNRLPIYVKRLRLGLVNPTPCITVVSESPATVLLDGDNGQGVVVAVYAMNLCIERARSAGAAFVGVRNTNHFAACG